MDNKLLQFLRWGFDIKRDYVKNMKFALNEDYGTINNSIDGFFKKIIKKEGKIKGFEIVNPVEYNIYYECYKKIENEPKQVFLYKPTLEELSKDVQEDLEKED